MGCRCDKKLVVAALALLLTPHAVSLRAWAATESGLPLDSATAAAPLSWEATPERGADWQRLEAEGHIQFDGQTGDYRIGYTTPTGENKAWVFEPANKLRVEVHAEVVYHPETCVYTYTYTVLNDPASIQYMHKFSVSHPGAQVWGASALPDDPQVEGGWRFSPTALKRDLASWGYTEGGGPGIAPGKTAVFSFQSDAGPASVHCYANGYVPTPWFPDREAPVDPRPLFIDQSSQGMTVGPVVTASAAGLSGYVSLRPLLSSLGWSLTWDSTARSVLARQKERTLSIALGSREIILNGARVSVLQPAKMMGGRVHVSADVVNHLDPGLAAQEQSKQGTA